MAEGEPGAGGAGRISIDELAALNDEIAALVRAGVPLDRGLLGAGADLHGRLRGITTALGRRLSRGESLPDALEAEKSAIPPLYRAVVEAGARSGRLPAALEALSRFVRSYSEARAAIGVALWYPILVLSLAYFLFLGLLILIVPRFIAAFESLGLEVIWPLRWLERLGEHAPYWWPLWPVLLLLLLLVPGGDRALRRLSRPRPGRSCECFPGCSRCWPTTRRPAMPICSHCCSSTRSPIRGRWSWRPRPRATRR